MRVLSILRIGYQLDKELVNEHYREAYTRVLGVIEHWTLAYQDLVEVSQLYQESQRHQDLPVFLGKLCVSKQGTYLDNLVTDKASRRRFWWTRGYGGHGLQGELGFVTDVVMVESRPRPNPKNEIGYQGLRFVGLGELCQPMGLNHMTIMHHGRVKIELRLGRHGEKSWSGFYL